MEYKVEIDEYHAPEPENEFRTVVAALVNAKAAGNPNPQANVTIPEADENKIRRRIREAAIAAGFSAFITGHEKIKREKGSKAEPEVRLSFVLRPPITRARGDKSEQ